MKAFPSTFSDTLIIVTEHIATPTNQSTTQVLLSNPQPRTTIYNTSGTSKIRQTLQKALSSRTQLAKRGLTPLTFKYLAQDLQMFFPSLGEDSDVIHINSFPHDALVHMFHEPVEGGR